MGRAGRGDFAGVFLPDGSGIYICKSMSIFKANMCGIWAIFYRDTVSDDGRMRYTNHSSHALIALFEKQLVLQMRAKIVKSQ